MRERGSTDYVCLLRSLVSFFFSRFWGDSFSPIVSSPTEVIGTNSAHAGIERQDDDFAEIFASDQASDLTSDLCKCICSNPTRIHLEVENQPHSPLQRLSPRHAQNFSPYGKCSWIDSFNLQAMTCYQASYNNTFLRPVRVQEKSFSDLWGRSL